MRRLKWITGEFSYHNAVVENVSAQTQRYHISIASKDPNTEGGIPVSIVSPGRAGLVALLLYPLQTYPDSRTVTKPTPFEIATVLA